MPFAFLMTNYLKRLEAKDPQAVAVQQGAIRIWRTIVLHLISHRGKEWWEVGFHQPGHSQTAH